MASSNGVSVCRTKTAMVNIRVTRNYVLTTDVIHFTGKVEIFALYILSRNSCLSETGFPQTLNFFLHDFSMTDACFSRYVFQGWWTKCTCKSYIINGFPSHLSRQITPLEHDISRGHNGFSQIFF